MGYPSKGSIHRATAGGTEDLVFIETQIGECDEDDIIRLEDDYGKSGNRINKKTMIQKLIKEFPVSTVTKLESNSRTFYTKEEVNLLISAAIDKAVAEARAIDEESMAKHNRDATVISMILGFTTLALFVDGLLRMLGIIPPFMHLDVNILDRIETDIIDKIKQVPIQKLFQR